MENNNHNDGVDFLLSRISNRYLIYTQDLRKDGATTLLTVFMTIFL